MDETLAQVTLNGAGPSADLDGCTHAHQKFANARATLVAQRLLYRNIRPTSQGSRFNGEHGRERDDRYYYWSGAGNGFGGHYAGIGVAEGFAFLATATIAAAAGVVAIADDAKNESRVANRTGSKVNLQEERKHKRQGFVSRAQRSTGSNSILCFSIADFQC